jgi:hypothetical protein
VKVALLLLRLAIPVHEFYSSACCSGTHCHPVPCGEITSSGDGWSWQGRTFPHFMLHVAPDGQCHVCVAAAPTCIYLPPGM